MGAERCDLVIAGGGPAGLATAIRAAQVGLSVLVADRRRPPIDRACGEGVMPDGVARMQELGVELPRKLVAPFRGIRYLDGEVVAEASFPGPPGLGIRRLDLHEALVRRAEALDVELRWGVAVRGLGDRGFETDSGVLEGRWLVAADGRTSAVRRWAGLDRRSARPRRVGVRRHFSVESWTDHVEVYWGDGCEAYVTPVGSGEVGVAVLREAGRADFDEIVRRFPILVDRLGDAPVASRDRGGGPFGQRSRSVARGKLALVGDAGGSLDPITGDGLSLAFQQAFALVAALEAEDLGRYAADWRRLRRVPQTLTALLLAAERRPWLRRRVVRALASNRPVFEQLLAFGAREDRPRLLGSRGLLSLALRLARSGV